MIKRKKGILAYNFEGSSLWLIGLIALCLLQGSTLWQKHLVKQNCLNHEAKEKEEGVSISQFHPRTSPQ
jgi:hypothetical protein